MANANEEDSLQIKRLRNAIFMEDCEDNKLSPTVEYPKKSKYYKFLRTMQRFGCNTPSRIRACCQTFVLLLRVKYPPNIS